MFIKEVCVCESLIYLIMVNSWLSMVSALIEIAKEARIILVRFLD